MKISRCLCCCSLQSGFYTYGVITLMFRFCILTTLLFSSVWLYQQKVEYFVLSGTAIGWILTSSATLFIALKGIALRKSLLLYPYSIALVIEIMILGAAIPVFIFAIVQPTIAITLAVLFVFNGYTFVCFISLYHKVKDAEMEVCFEQVSLKDI